MAAVPSLEEAKPPNCDTWKSEFARRVASKKISEEFEYFAQIYDKLSREDFKGQIKSEDAVLFALEQASKRRPLLNTKEQVSSLPKGSKVCIVGAGMAGLYIAMILDALDIPNLSYEILEGSDRVGGRVYTHYFSKEVHDYYDVGAMRFPDIEIMDKTFKLFEHLEVPKLPYIMSSPQQPSRYNDRTVINYQEKSDDDVEANDTKDYDVFRVSEKYGGRIMPELVDSPSKYVTEAFEPFKSRMRKNWAKGFNALMKYDNFSVRGYMMSHGITPLSVAPEISSALPTLTWSVGTTTTPFNGSKRLLTGVDYMTLFHHSHNAQYDTTLSDMKKWVESFSEGVIDSMDFDYYSEYVDKSKHVDWFCIDGGTQVVPDRMNGKLKTKPDLGKRVTKIGYNRGYEGLSPMTVKVEGETATREYITVFATPTLACLQRIDLTELELLYEQKDAIQSLHYDTASKVGMQFDYAWWIKYGIKGGLGKTDMPLRTCVYPSYNINDKNIEKPGGGPAVLLCSYSWAQDAARIGSLMKGDPKLETELRQTLFNNLTHLHLENAKASHPEMTFEKLYEEIKGSYITHYAFDWHNHEYSSGAYGKFAPGQFASLYSALTCPTADSRFHFVGEAVSAHHGWIVGALDSAHQAVINFLRRFNLKVYEDKLEKIKWLGKVPDEIDRETSIKKVVLGQVQPDERLKARSAVESGKTEVIDVAQTNGVAK